MSEVKHTPLPWKVVPSYSDHYNPAIGKWVSLEQGYNIVGSDGRDVVSDEGIYANEAGEPNARLIVQAVNSHGDLVEALREARKTFSNIYDHSDCGYATYAAEAAMDEIDTALSKVLELGEGL